MNPNDSGTANNGNGHLNVPGDEVPPPPYSETDVYSTSGSSRSPHTASAPSVASATAAAATPSHSFIDDAASSTADEIIYTPPLTPRTSPGSGQPAASLYFDLRPAPQQDTATDIIRMTLVHNIEVTDISQPDDFPYESDWAARDVTALDWSTFINFLIPDHTTRQNEVVIHRKLLDEMQRSEAGSTNNSTAQVEAQLNQIADARNPASPDSQRRRRDVEATVQQWNDGFFGPRGIQVRLEPPRSPSAQMPGAWEANFDQASEAGRSTQSSQTAGRSAPASGGSWGGFQIDDNGVRYGNSFVADQNGLRIGNLIMDQRGIRFHNDAAQGQLPAADAARDVRGRTAYQHGGDEEAGHKRSCSVSSTSSSSSSSSESSIGSLPSYDDIPVNSVQLYIARLQDWTKNPDQLRTRGDVKQLKAELKSVPKSRDVPTDVDKKALKAQIKTLTTVWRQVKKNQRRERRAQRKERRGKRRAERKEKRQHRKEMRKARKEARRGQSTPVPPVPPPPPPPSIPPLPPHVPGTTVPPVPPVPPVNTSPWTGTFPWGRGRGGRGGHHHHPHPHPHPHPHQPHYGLPRGRGWGAWNNPQASNSRGFAGENGVFGPNGPFGPEGPFGPGGPFGEKGIFGGDGMFGPKGFFGPGQDEKQQQQQREQQQQQAEQQRQQQQQHAEQQRQQQQQHAEQQRQHYQQQAKQQRQHAEQQRQHYQQAAEQQRQHLQQHQQQQWQQYQQQRQGSASSAHSLPGSWPDEKKQQQQPPSASQDDEQIPPPGPRASAKYNTIGALERTIQAQTAAAEKAEGLQKEQVEKAIATMKKQLESLRVQADEEYAKELSGN
ncbi:hypothetical protein GGI42DRAFT_109360 [Trichoderma sp. SZMC 28013]